MYVYGCVCVCVQFNYNTFNKTGSISLSIYLKTMFSWSKITMITNSFSTQATQGVESKI